MLTALKQCTRNLHYEKMANGTVKCIENEIPFDMPDSWAWTRISTITQFVSDGDHQPPPQAASGIPFLVISDVASGVIDFSKARFVGNEYYNALPITRKAIKGDVLFTVTGSYGIPVEILTSKPFCFQRHIALLRPCIIPSRMLSLILASNWVMDLCNSTATGIAQKTVGLNSIRYFLVPLPPFEEQERIANAVDLAFKQISTIESEKSDLLAIISQAKSKILDFATRGKLVPQDPADESASLLLERIRAEKEQLIKAGKIRRDKNESYIFRGDDKSYYEKVEGSVRNIDDEIPFDVPVSWGFVRLNTAMPYEQPQPYIVTSTEYDASYPTPVLTAGKSFIIGYTNETDGIKTDLPTVIFDDFTTDSKYVDFPFKVKSSAMKILTADSSFADIKFYYYVMQQIECNHSTHKRYWISDFSQKIVPLPPLQEQKRIVAAIEVMEQQLATIMGSLN